MRTTISDPTVAFPHFLKVERRRCPSKVCLKGIIPHRPQFLFLLRTDWENQGLFVKEVTVELVIFGYLGRVEEHSQQRKVRNVKARIFSAHKARG